MGLLFYYTVDVRAFGSYIPNPCPDWMTCRRPNQPIYVICIPELIFQFVWFVVVDGALNRLPVGKRLITKPRVPLIGFQSLATRMR